MPEGFIGGGRRKGARRCVDFHAYKLVIPTQSRKFGAVWLFLYECEDCKVRTWKS